MTRRKGAVAKLGAGDLDLAAFERRERPGLVVSPLTDVHPGGGDERGGDERPQEAREPARGEKSERERRGGVAEERDRGPERGMVCRERIQGPEGWQVALRQDEPRHGGERYRRQRPHRRMVERQLAPLTPGFGPAQLPPSNRSSRAAAAH